jgi:hypothetical protein
MGDEEGAKGVARGVRVRCRIPPRAHLLHLGFHPRLLARGLARLALCKRERHDRAERRLLGLLLGLKDVEERGEAGVRPAFALDQRRLVLDRPPRREEREDRGRQTLRHCRAHRFRDCKRATRDSEFFFFPVFRDV